MDILMEDKQPFALLVDKVPTPAEALACPLTSVPLALVNVDKTFRLETTALRNHIIKTAKATKTKLEINETVDWYVDGM